MFSSAAFVGAADRVRDHHKFIAGHAEDAAYQLRGPTQMLQITPLTGDIATATRAFSE